MDKYGRSEWNDIIGSVAMLFTTRSIDPRTKHGCIIYDPQHRIKSVGYNGPLAGSDDEKFPKNSTEKYMHIFHSETNCLANYRGDLKDCIAFVTGHPCVECFKSLVQNGVRTIYWGPISSFMLETEEGKKQIEAINKMIEYSPGITLKQYDGNFWEPFKLMVEYLATKGIYPPYDLMMSVVDAYGKGKSSDGRES